MPPSPTPPHPLSLYRSSAVVCTSDSCSMVPWDEYFRAVAYVLQQGVTMCPDFHLSVCYGTSFMKAPVGVLLCLLSWSLHLALERTLNKGLTLHDGDCEDWTSSPVCIPVIHVWMFAYITSELTIFYLMLLTNCLDGTPAQTVNILRT